MYIYRGGMNRIKYIHPDFKEMLGIVPSEVGREIDLSFDIAARIHEVLVRKGWSQADFARNAGKKEAEISKWMSGQHNFTIRTIAFIENVLGEEILSVKRYRTHKAAATAAKQYARTHSPYGAGLLNDSGGEGYSSKQKK